MRKINLTDILDIAEYERQRLRRRADIIVHKNLRRMEIGPYITLMFETFDTMLYQVQEMMRSERMVQEPLIEREIHVYNELVPERRQLCATMMIAIEDAHDSVTFLRKIVTLPQHTFLVIDEQAIAFQYDLRQFSHDRAGSVHFIKCSLSEDQAELFSLQQSRILIRFTHPSYRYEQEMSASLKETLALDMKR
jgi:hypothetical protein